MIEGNDVHHHFPLYLAGTVGVEPDGLGIAVKALFPILSFPGGVSLFNVFLFGHSGFDAKVLPSLY